MLNLNEVYGEPGSIVTPFLRSFMSTYQVGIRNREANSSALHNLYVKAFGVEEAADIATKIVKPYDMIVKDVIRPGDEIYGVDESSIGDADPLPLLKSVATKQPDVFEMMGIRSAPLPPLSPFANKKVF
jgi:hypothetical protein